MRVLVRITKSASSARKRARYRNGHQIRGCTKRKSTLGSGAIVSHPCNSAGLDFQADVRKSGHVYGSMDDRACGHAELTKSKNGVTARRLAEGSSCFKQNSTSLLSLRGYQYPISFHHRMPTTLQIRILGTEANKPIRHQVCWLT